MIIVRVLSVLALSAAPVSELRGGIPLALSFGFPPFIAITLAIIGNLLPVLLLLLLLKEGEGALRKFPLFDRLLTKVCSRARRKGELIARYGPIGLILLVAIPLPATGAWTGAIAAVIFGVPTKKAFFLISIGVLIAGVVVLLASMGVIHLFTP